MHFKEIKKKYSGEWVLIEYDELDENLQVKKGRVIAHSHDRDNVYKALSKTAGKDVAIEYLGPYPKELTVMFFFE